MRSVLVDTSVWVDHFRRHNEALAKLLALDLVIVHPLIIGELACGTPPNRSQTLADLECLQQPTQASIRDVMAFIEREHLYGLGCGLVDMLLLTSTLMTTGSELWTQDKRLAALAERFDVLHQAALH